MGYIFQVKENSLCTTSGERVLFPLPSEVVFLFDYSFKKKNSKNNQKIVKLNDICWNISDVYAFKLINIMI